MQDKTSSKSANSIKCTFMLQQAIIFCKKKLKYAFQSIFEVADSLALELKNFRVRSKFMFQGGTSVNLLNLSDPSFYSYLKIQRLNLCLLTCRSQILQNICKYHEDCSIYMPVEVSRVFSHIKHRKFYCFRCAYSIKNN